MAENKETFSLNLGIQDTNIVGDYEAAEAFLSDTEIEEIKEEKVEEKKPEEKKVEAKEEEPADPLEGEDDEKDEEAKEGEFDFSALGKSLFSLGIFTEQEDDEEIVTPEDLLSRFEKEKRLGATTWLEGFLSKFGPDRQEMFDAIFINGVDPKDYIPVFNSVEDFEGLDIAQEDTQKHVFREFYRRVGLDETTIEKKLQKAIDYGDLETEAKEFHPKLIEQDKAKLQRLSQENAAKQQEQRRLDSEYKTNIQRKLTEAVQKREIKGIPITQQKANEVFDFMYTPKYKTPDGKILTEFDKFILESKKTDNLEQRIILSLLKLDNFDFSKIEKNGISKESRTLFSEMAQKVTKSKTRDINKIQDKVASPWSKL